MDDEQKTMDRLAELDAKFNSDVILTDDERKEYQFLDEQLYIIRYNRLIDTVSKYLGAPKQL